MQTCSNNICQPLDIISKNVHILHTVRNMFLSKRYYENPNTKFNMLINTYDTEKLKTKLKKIFQVCSS